MHCFKDVKKTSKYENQNQIDFVVLKILIPKNCSVLSSSLIYLG